MVQVLLAETNDTMFNFEMECTDSLSTTLEHLDKGVTDVVLLDLSLPDSQGLDTFNKVRSQSPGVPIVVFSGMVDEELSIQAVKNGAQDYLIKGQVDGNLLVRSIRYAIERQQVEISLLESEHRYRRLVQLMPDIVYTIDPKGIFTFVNDAIQILGYTPEEIIGKHFSIIINPLDLDAISSEKVLPKYTGKATTDETSPKLFDERRTGDRNTKGLEVRIKPKNVKRETFGRIEWLSKETAVIEVTSSGHYDKDIYEKEKRFLGTIGVIRDISERRQAFEQISKLSLAVEQGPGMVIIMDTNGKIEYVNPKFVQLTGYTAGEALGKTPDILRSDTVPPGKYSELWKTVTSGKDWKGEFCSLKKDSEQFWESVQISPIRDSNGEITHLLKVSEDVTDRKQAEETIQRMAYYDSLTELPNRTLFNDRLSQALSHARRKNEIVAVLFLDLDQFKLINDTLGHALGDQLLRSVASKLNKYVRVGDTVSRLGGDEFTMLFQGINNADDVDLIAQKIIEAIRVPFVIGNHELSITTSMGIAVYPDDGEDGDTLLKNSDAALYHAKETGRDKFQRYDHSLHIKVSKKLMLESKLRFALDKEQFLLYYQPKIDIKTKQIIGAEALLRWQHPDAGLVSPLDFISFAEATGMIVGIGEWVILTACKQIKAWQEANYQTLRIAVNLSAQNFMRQNLIETVKKILKNTGVSPSLLEFEITESNIMQNVESTVHKLVELHKLGIQISIDDFGTGYSSLSYLRKFPIHTLKIDRSFVCDIVENEDDAAIVTAIIAIAKKLKLNVVAEGVETESQLSFLEQQQCDMAQGYLFSKPVPVQEFEKLLVKRSRNVSED